jgi:hypothetical protein
MSFGALAIASSACAQSRGELLYSTHCIACHTSQMHWREQRAATDWASLNTQVRRWQGTASLAWSDEDIQEVVAYLNDRIYRFERPSAPAVSSAPANGMPGALTAVSMAWAAHRTGSPLPAPGVDMPAR